VQLIDKGLLKGFKDMDFITKGIFVIGLKRALNQ